MIIIKTLIITEKPNIALMMAVNGISIFGEFKLNGKVINKNDFKKNTKVMEQQVKSKGYIENDKYIISFAQGHLIELFQAYDYNSSYKLWGNIPDDYIPNPFKTKIISGKERMYQNLEKLIKSPEVSLIINACDGDREGNLIFELIYEYSKSKKPVKRLWTDEHTEKDLINAYKNIKDASYYENLTKAGRCRMESDWVLGGLLTAKTTINLSKGKNILNVGRVQTAVLSEIVRIEDLNKNFKSKKYYNIIAKFKTEANEEYEGVYEEDFDDPIKADNLIKALKNKSALVLEYTFENKNSYSPSLFDQTSLGIHMAKYHHLDPDKTLEAAQSLYENGYTTYPRTSSNYITKSKADDFYAMYQKIAIINPLAKEHPFNKNNKRIVDDTKVHSHPAIIPTGEIPDLSRLNVNEKLVYQEIVKRVISVNFPPATDRQQTIFTDVDGFMFKSSGKKEVSKGWREVYEIKVKDTSLPEVNEYDEVSIISMDKKEVTTQPPKRYTMATILGFMESCGKKIEDEEMRELMKDKGIGTSATRANILKGLQSNGYVITKGNAKTLYPTEKGENLIHIFPVEELKNAEFTGEMEMKLNKVEKGKLNEENYMEDVVALYLVSVQKIKGSTEKVVSFENSSVGNCPLCGSEVFKRTGKFGTFYGCSGWKEGCKFSINKICEKLLTDKQVTQLLKNGVTGQINGFKKKDGKGTFSAKLKLDNKTGKLSFDFSK